ncbi:hypothetical protein [Bacillus cereus]|uniref:hypothetical protein n=1 Tax=Bacillus cereus TaxID=1396 RepID=UPI000330DA29|nr:hypothetical protein [Bacillus cereus]EOQ02681.1 hypothetical protein IIY_01816 [Bacillus cereus VD140]
MNYILVILIIPFLSVLLYFFCYKAKRIERINYLKSQKERYSQSIENNKILLVGGSSVLYSFNTLEMNKNLNKPIVNFGLNVGLGVGFLIDCAKKNLKNGDTVILCLEYALYFKKDYDIFSYEYFRMYNKRALLKFNFVDHFKFLLANFKLNLHYRQKQYELTECGSYININGVQLDPQKEKPLKFPGTFVDNKSLKKLKGFKRYCKQNNIQLYITFPSTLYFEEYQTNSYLNDLFKYLDAHYTLIGYPNKYLVNKASIYDSVYHLNSKGQTKRTSIFIQELEEYNII